MNAFRRALVRFLKIAVALLALVVALLLGPAYMLASQQVPLHANWQTADRTSADLAPDPARTPQAVVQVYAARTFEWRGAFGVHTWIATKTAGASRYRVYQVLSWRRPTVESGYATPDRNWYGNPPTLLADIRGDSAARAIQTIERVVPRYPEANRYRIWPGPNSNTFIAWVVRQVPELSVDFPPNAIGKDYLLDGIVARAPSHTGYQLSLGGLLGVVFALDEGVELDLLGLTVGVDFQSPALKLPGIGRVGMAQPTGSAGEKRVEQDAQMAR
ncbi:DUF3750 domain-containing protein [Salinicola rhizosphaerae]|uniref:DUF3750 domain-containing protein n=1 Tax=Salinicola rhizosphaerae TaxID=1443141 RepID=A0ABQ3DXZ8_9GAMM|nr:DUF3750 domain-containing protein [Salinicola rhizosphaerae]GHB17185.1 hypothetical protein GCM10009038_14880 [Salinicola rhizosphaerae]